MKLLDDFPPHLQTELEDLLDVDRWRALAPMLHVSELTTADFTGRSLRWDESILLSVGASLREEGYFQLPPPTWDLSLAAIADAIRAIVAAQHLPVFAFMYDETWLLFIRLGNLLAAVLGDDYRMQPAFWAWYVDGRIESAGWRPHRDQDQSTLLPDRSPKSLSIWIPLTDATPLNGCMYILPANRDATYAKPFSTNAEIDIQDVRALPSQAGGILGWTQAVLHWGGRADSKISTPRISVSTEFQRGDEKPYKRPLYSPRVLPSPMVRLRLILRQLLQYQHLYELSPNLKAVAETFVLSDRKCGTAK